MGQIQSAYRGHIDTPLNTHQNRRSESLGIVPPVSSQTEHSRLEAIDAARDWGIDSRYQPGWQLLDSTKQSKQARRELDGYRKIAANSRYRMAQLHSPNIKKLSYRTCLSKIGHVQTESLGNESTAAKTIRPLSLPKAAVNNRCWGALFGLLVGDALGAPFEFRRFRARQKDLQMHLPMLPGGSFKLERGQWTDDSAMALCLADSLNAHNGQVSGEDLMDRFLLWWHCGYNNSGGGDRASVGLGGTIGSALRRYSRLSGQRQRNYTETATGSRDSSGNGSLMRLAPIAISGRNNCEQAMQNAAKQSFLTHRGHQSADACRLMTFMIIAAINAKATDPQERKKEVFEKLSEFTAFTKAVNSPSSWPSREN